MLDKEIKEKILNHLSDVLKPAREEELGPAAALVEFPTKNPRSSGGLSPQGEIFGTLDRELGEASLSHREQTRVKIRAVRATSALFVASKTRKLSETERDALINGIRFSLNGKEDRIKTTRKNGMILTPEFKEMMGDLYKATRSNLPDLAKTLKIAAGFQQKEEDRERAVTGDVPEMA